MSETRAAAAIQRAEAGGASRAAWGAFWAADAVTQRLLTTANEAADARWKEFKAGETLSARLLSAARDAERVAIAAEAAFADAVKRFPQEGD